MYSCHALIEHLTLGSFVPWTFLENLDITSMRRRLVHLKGDVTFILALLVRNSTFKSAQSM